MNFWKSFLRGESGQDIVKDDSPIQKKDIGNDSIVDLVAPKLAVEQSEEIELPEIPEGLFVEYDRPSELNLLKTRNNIKSKKMEPIEKSMNEFDLQYLYNFLEKDYQQEGYNDALSNPDMSSMEEKIKLIRMQLDITIAKVKTAYSGVLRNINFHIESRSRNGMVDIVDELISKRTTIEEEISKVLEIEQGAKSGSGISETLIMSYKLGFKNGYAAISHSQLI